MNRGSVALLWLGLASIACAPKPNRAERAADRARPYLVAFERFDRWARRAGMSEGVLRDRNAVCEAMFAPIRNDAAILCALVRIGGARERLFPLPPKLELPTSLDWIAVRDPSLGALRVALPEPCPVTIARKRGPEPARCVLIERRASAAEQAPITVTLAFADP